MLKNTRKKHKEKRAMKVAGGDEQFRLMQELFQKNEELHPDLAAVLTDEDEEFRMIQHPLLHCLYNHPALHNYQYKVAKEELAKAESEKDWIKVIRLHERPYRLGALKQYADKLSDEQYWETLGGVWANIENIHQYGKDVHKLLTSNRPHREKMMDKEEAAELASLPEELTIYRGFVPGKNRDGWSWTLNKDKAEWFAKRFAPLFGKGKVATGTCAKSDVIALLLGRNEDEVIIDPGRVTVK